MEGIYNQELVNKYYPGAKMIDAMKVWALPDKKKDMLAEICGSGDYFGQIKKDGNFYQFVTTDSKSYLFSRTESVTNGLLTEKIENVPHIEEALSSLPKDTIVIGEIYYPGLTSNEVRKVMGCKPALAVRRQENELGWIKFYIHDIIYFNGISLLEKGAFERYTFLKAVYEKLELDKSGHIELAEVWEDNLFERTAEALENGEEGMVLKKKDYPYVPGKKPAWSCIKVKQVDYADVICMGLEVPTMEYEGTEMDSWGYWAIFKQSEIGKGDWELYQKHNTPIAINSPLFKTVPVTKPYYNGWCGSISIGAYNEKGELINIGSVSSGLTDELKEQIKENPNNYIGQVCMVQVMQKFDQALRHPIFKGFREDKNAKECTLKSVFND